MSLSVWNKLEVLKKDVAEKANPKHALPQEGVVAVKPLLNKDYVSQCPLHPGMTM